MSSTTVSVRIDPVIKKRLEKLAKSTGRSRSFLAAEAINEYLDLNEWQVAGIQKAAAKIRPQLPVRVDEDTTMIGVVAAGKNIIYQMSVSTDIPEARIHEAQAEMQRTVALNVCQNEKTKALVEAGATMSYAYTLPSGRTFETDVNHC